MPSPSSGSQALADRLDSHRDEIIGRWLESVEQQELATRPLSRPELVNSLPEFLGEVAGALRRGGPCRGVESHSRTAAAGRSHGGDRYRRGFDLRTVVWEYGVLRDILIEFVAESKLPYTLHDVRVLSHAVCSGVAGAIDQFSAEREADVRASYAAVERARDLERQLIAIVSHDLRNPLAAISMGAELALRSGELGGVAEKALKRLRASAERATRLIGDLLDFAKERMSGRLPVKPGPADLAALIHEAVEEAEFTFPTRAIVHHERGELVGRWDPDRIAQVLSNLLANALKFSPPGTQVTLTAEGVHDEVTLVVHNEGPPIPAERLPSVFEPLQRAHEGADAQGSLGLGLYISRHIVMAHGGQIGVSSSAEAGTTFTVKLPRECCKTDE